MRKIAILSMTYLPRIGGLQRVTYELASQYSKKGFDVHIITGVVPAHSSDKRINNVYVHRKHLLFKIGQYESPIMKFLIHSIYIIRAFFTLLQLKPDHIHCQSPYSSLAAWLTFKLFKTPYSIGYHAEIKTQVGIMLTPNLSRYWKKLPYLMDAQNRFVLTEDMKQELESGGLPATVIPNGVDTSVYFPVNTGNTFKTNPIIICVGRLVESKAIDDALRVVSNVSKQSKNVKLVIVGDGNISRYIRTSG